MKICTTCGGSFDEEVMMCPNDGTPLFASAVEVEDDPDDGAEAAPSDPAPPQGDPAPKRPNVGPFDADTVEVKPFDRPEDAALETEQEEEPDTPLASSPTHTDTEEIVANLLASEGAPSPAPEDDDPAESDDSDVVDAIAIDDEVEATSADDDESPVAALSDDNAEAQELPEVEPLPELEAMPGPEITDAPTPVPDEDEAPSESVLDLIEDSIADDSAIQRMAAAELPVSIDDESSKRVVIPAKREPKASGGNKLLWVGAAVIVLILLVVVGYFVILPALGG